MSEVHLCNRPLPSPHCLHARSSSHRKSNDDLSPPSRYSGLYIRLPPGPRGVVLARLAAPSNRDAVGVYDRFKRLTQSCKPEKGGLYGPNSRALFVDENNVPHLGGGEGRDAPTEDATEDAAKANPTLRIHPDGKLEVMLKDSDEATLTIEPDGRVVVRSDRIRLGGEDADDAVVTASRLESELDVLKNKLSAHVHLQSDESLTKAPQLLLDPEDPSDLESLNGSLRGWPSTIGSDSVLAP